MSSRAAAVSASADDVAGMGAACENPPTDRDILSEHVLGM